MSNPKRRAEGQDQYDALLDHIKIRMKLMAQRRAWILRGLVERDTVKRDAAMNAFLKDLETPLRRYRLEPLPPAGAHGGPKNLKRKDWRADP